ncbi:MAG: hypothetical protein ACQESG_06995 [Nanobdellota archaeon]
MIPNTVHDWITRHGYSAIATSSPQAILIGQMFGRHDDEYQHFTEAQEELIKEVYPEYVLFPAGTHTYDSNTRFGYLPGRKLGEDDLNPFDPLPEYCIRWSDTYLATIIGSTLSSQEYHDIADRLEDWSTYEHKTRSKEEWETHMKHIQDTMFDLEKRQIGQTTAQFAKKSMVPVISIMGAACLEAESPLYTELDKENIGYIAIDQTSTFIRSLR